MGVAFDITLTLADRGPSMRKLLMTVLALVFILIVIAMLLRILNPLPSQEHRPADIAVVDRPSEIVAQSAAMSAGAPGKTGLEVIPTGIDAFAARLALAKAATRTIDAQYYIWEGDLSGRMLLEELVKAADRGVRVRLLIDDNTTSGLDPMWIAANSHPNISVRLFNPLTIRHPRTANYLFSALRLNRRMHNKSMTFDGAATVIGGRNVGDEYFGAKEKGLFIDLDVVATGKVVGEVEQQFDRYWNSISAFPAENILDAQSATTLDQLRNPDFEDKTRATDYREAAETVFRRRYESGKPLPLLWTDVRLVADNPDKAIDKASRSDLVASQIAPLIRNAKQRFDLVSGYFVPGDQGAELLEGLAERGVKTRVVTNSIAVTDVPVVHAGYAPFRKPLLQSGVRLFEVRPMGEQREKPKDMGTKFSGGGESVHAKTFSIDGKTIFIGSFNFDMRSALLNCEMGFIFDAPDLATQMNGGLDARLPEYSYEVKLDDQNMLAWQTREGGKTVTLQPEPNTTGFSRAMTSFLGWLPIKWLL